MTVTKENFNTAGRDVIEVRTSEGGFWHKKIYPSQMWLDGLYMGEPFYAECAATFNEPAAFDDIAKQFIRMKRHARDDKTGLLYHGLGRIAPAALVQPADRPFSKLLGPWDGLVRNGARRYARSLSTKAFAAKSTDCDLESPRASSDEVSEAIRALVSGC